jgi:hypothetical protein
MLSKDHSGHNSEVVKMSEQSVGVRVVLTLGSEVVKTLEQVELELSGQSQSFRYSDWVGVIGQRDDVASAYCMCYALSFLLHLNLVEGWR